MANIMRENGVFLPGAVAAQFRDTMESVQLHYNALSVHAMQCGRLLYNSTIKLHMCYHLGCLARLTNPRFVWAYAFEDFMRVIITCGKACMAGTLTQNVPRKVVENYRLALHLRMMRSS